MIRRSSRPRERTEFRNSKIEAAQKSPVYQFVKKWGIALPLHPEFRTLPMLFYVPPLGPVLAKVENGVYDNIADKITVGTVDEFT